MSELLPVWFLPTVLSALLLGLYDLSKKHAVNSNSVMPVLFFATLCGTAFFLLVSALTGTLTDAIICTKQQFWLIVLKSTLVSSSWIFVYYAMRELPISIASPIRASSPLWTFLGSLILYHEIPTLLQGLGMLLIFIGYYCFSVLGKLEGITFRSNKGMIFIVLGTMLGAGSALYDKYLLNSLSIPFRTVQLWFSIDLVFILGLVYLIRSCFFKMKHKFLWRWTIPATGILLICADFTYFYAVSIPDIHISILSLIRRCSCLVTFLAGAYLFRETNKKRKALALLVILTGVLILALAK